RPDLTLTLRTQGRIQKLEDFNNIVLSTDESGGRILLSDVARVEDGIAERSGFTEMNGLPAITVTVSKQSGTNTIAVIEGVKERIHEMEESAKRRGYNLRVV